MFYWGIFITTHWEHFLTHWYNALMVAQNSFDCWCRLITSFAVHTNIAKIAISTSTSYFDTVKKAQASLCKRADSQEPLLPAQEILIFIILSSDSLRKCADSPEYSLLAWIAHKSHLRQHKRFCTVTKAEASLYKCVDSPDPSLLAQNAIQSPFESPHENFKLWRRLRLDQANVQTRQSHRCLHECHQK